MYSHTYNGKWVARSSHYFARNFFHIYFSFSFGLWARASIFVHGSDMSNAYFNTTLFVLWIFDLIEVEQSGNHIELFMCTHWLLCSIARISHACFEEMEKPGKCGFSTTFSGAWGVGGGGGMTEFVCFARRPFIRYLSSICWLWFLLNNVTLTFYMSTCQNNERFQKKNEKRTDE